MQELTLLDQASQALAEAQSFDQIKEIRDKAEAVRKYAQSASLGLDLQNRAAEVKLRAERRAGKLLSQMMLRGGDRRSKNHRERLKLDDLGISRNQSTRWQMEAKVPEDVFREHIKQTLETGRELTSASLVRLARRLEETELQSDRRPQTVYAANGNGRSTAVCDSSNGKAPLHRRDQHGPQSPGDVLAEILEDLTNHHQLIEGVLQPLYADEGVTLQAAERRVLRYLLLEVQQLLARLEKMHRAGQLSACAGTLANGV